MEHTPWPWSINGNKIDGNGYHIASINSHATTEGRANARLIAAAPDLFSFVQEWLDRQGTDENYMTVKARAIIAKATNA